jgi:penicillin-binding protein 1C
VCHAAPVAEIPTFEAVRAAWQPADVLITDRQGVIMQRVRRDLQVRRLGWVRLDALSPTLEATLLSAEDKRFHQHGGVDWLAAGNALLEKLKTEVSREAAHPQRHARGASTLTMQLAALLDPALRPAHKQRRNWQQKWDQAAAALEIERHWQKAQILEAYLNLVPLRGETVGVAAASEFWLGKSVDALDLAEAALLVALIRQPQATPVRAGERACGIVAGLSTQTLAALARPSCEVIKHLAEMRLNMPGGGRAYAQLAPHVARRLLAEMATRVPASTDGQEARLMSTLDARLQMFVRDHLQQHLRELAGRNVEDGAAVVLDNASGAVLAWVGSSGELSAAAQVDGVTAARQAGSTLKPFLYGLAIDRRLLTAASLVEDSPLALTAENGAYIPQNYDRHFQGRVSARTALASSLNIPAVRTLLLTGAVPFYELLQRAGFSTLTESADFYGLSLALGGGEVRLLDLANAYRMLANGGRWSPVAPLFAAETSPAPPQERRVFTAGTAFIISDILADRGARAPTFGLENALATRVPASVKTGTSKDMRDNWAVGYTARYTVAVWVGNFSGQPMWNVSGVQGAAPLWRDIVHFLHADAPPPVVRAPAGLLRARVEFEDIDEAARLEWFLPGTAMRRVASGVPGEAEKSAQTGMDAAEIAYPADGLIVAIDPDIPLPDERLPLRMRHQQAGYFWRLERQSATPCIQTLGESGTAEGNAWQPLPGHWRVTLRAADSGLQVAESRIQVRGSARHEAVCEHDEVAP